jgi:asparagine synthase (glutamine-hydrolysing)
MVAAHCGTEHHEVVLDAGVLKDSLQTVLDHFDEPFGDSSAVPTYLVSREARRQFTVALSGDGADEVFAGYRKYLSEHYLAMLGPYFLRRFVIAPLTGLLPTGRTGRLLELFRRIRRVLRADAPSRRQRVVAMLNMSPLDTGDTLGTKLGTHDFSAVRALLEAYLPAEPDLNDCLRFDQRLVLRDDMFVKVDRMGMKASLEVRSPFVDHHLIALANGLAPARKLDGTTRKKVLIEQLGHHLPAAIATRPKSGFEMPLGAWLRDDLAAWTNARLFDNRLDREGWVDHTALRRIWDLHRSGRSDCTEAIWQNIVFAAWFERIYA